MTDKVVASALSRVERAAQKLRVVRLTAKEEARRYEEQLVAAATAERDVAVREAYALLMSGRHGIKHMDIKRAMGTKDDRTYKSIVTGAELAGVSEVFGDWTALAPYSTDPWEAHLDGNFSEEYRLRVTRFYKWSGDAEFHLYPGQALGSWVPFTPLPDWQTQDFEDWPALDEALPDVSPERRAEIVSEFLDWVTLQVSLPVSERE